MREKRVLGLGLPVKVNITPNNGDSQGKKTEATIQGLGCRGEVENHMDTWRKTWNSLLRV